MVVFFIFSQLIFNPQKVNISNNDSNHLLEAWKDTNENVFEFLDESVGFITLNDSDYNVLYERTGTDSLIIYEENSKLRLLNYKIEYLIKDSLILSNNGIKTSFQVY